MKSYFDLVGDGGSGVADQVAEQRRAIEEALDPLEVFAVASGKGGVGKSTVTRLLALELQRRGRRPAILDVDFNGPSQARLSGLRSVVPVPGERGLVVPLDSTGIGVLSLGSLVAETESLEFESVTEGESFTWRSIREFAALGQLLSASDWSGFETLLLDLPPGAERTFQFAEFLGSRCRFVMVSLPSVLSEDVVSRALAALSRLDVEIIGYVENMSGYWCGVCENLQPLFQTDPEAALSIARIARLPFVPSLGGASGDVHEIPAALLQEVGSLCDNLLGREGPS